MLHRKQYENDNFPTETSIEQTKTEGRIMNYFYTYRQKQAEMFKSVKLLRDAHIQYCLKGLENLSTSFDCLDASRPWLCYWMLHALDLLGHQVSERLSSRIVDFLGRRCQDPNGGFGGGPGQLPHLAPTYAAVLSLCILKSKEAYDIIDRIKLKQFILSLKDEKSKGFRMHKDGEVDVRGSYTALTVAKLLNFMDEDVTRGIDEYVQSCQTYEGGIGSFFGNEAHGGYAFCGLAAMMLLKKPHKLHVESLMHWCARRQMDFEGGFQGRTNKLVDACYSFWMGATFPLLHATIQILDSRRDPKIFEYLQWTPPDHVPNLSKNVESSSFFYAEWLPRHGTFDMAECPTSTLIEEENDAALYPELEGEWYFDETALQEYLLLCCQSGNGGLLDKPGKSRDFYHTCYALSGLSIAQHQPSGNFTVLGDENNLLRKTNPIVNICTDKVEAVLHYFGNRKTL